MSASQAQDTQDYREVAPIPPAPPTPLEPSNRELFRAGFGSWALTRRATLASWWGENRKQVLGILRFSSLGSVGVLSVTQLLLVSSGLLPAGLLWWFAASLAVSFHWLVVHVYESCIEEGRKVLGLEEEKVFRHAWEKDS